MKEYNIISIKEATNACNLLKQYPTTRIPENDINNLINELAKDSVNV